MEALKSKGNYKRIWVVFTNQADLPYLKVLRQGFRHCFIIIHDGSKWLNIDPMANYMDVEVLPVRPDFNLPEWLEAQGHIVVQSKYNHQIKSSGPLAFLTCVEVCKRVLGLHRRLVFTPWQLYRHLKKINHKATLKIEKGVTSWEV